MNLPVTNRPGGQPSCWPLWHSNANSYFKEMLRTSLQAHPPSDSVFRAVPSVTGTPLCCSSGARAALTTRADQRHCP